MKFTLYVSAFAIASCLGVAATEAQVVQLPSIQTFSYSGSVLVPDSGMTYLGGVRRAASNYQRRGLNRAAGSTQGFPGAAVAATIIDHDEIDRQLLGTSAEKLATNAQGDGQRRQPESIAEARLAEGKALVRYARAKYRQGEQAAAFDGYRMALAVLDGRLRQLALEEFRRTFGAAATQVDSNLHW